MNNYGKTSGWIIAVIISVYVIIIALVSVSAILLFGKTDIPDIDEFISRVEDSKRNIENLDSIEDLFVTEERSDGSTLVTFELTSADLTALANEAIESGDDIPIEDIYLICNDDKTIDITALTSDITKYLDDANIPDAVKSLVEASSDRRMFGTIFIEYLGDNEFDIAIENVRFGNVNIPFTAQLLNPLTAAMSDTLQDTLNDMDDFSLQTFVIEDDLISMVGIRK